MTGSFQLVCYRLASVLGIIVLLHDPAVARLQLLDTQPHISVNVVVYRGVCGPQGPCIDADTHHPPPLCPL